MMINFILLVLLNQEFTVNIQRKGGQVKSG